MQARENGVKARSLRLAAVWLAAAMVAGAGAAGPYVEVSLALGQGLVRLFPAAEGYVVSVDAGEAYIDLAEKDLLRPGMELQVYRPGAEMVHPVTKQVLGAYETTLGHLRITEVRERYSRGALEAAGPGGVVAGDRVRVSARRLRALLSVTGTAPGVELGPLAQAVLGRGAESGRFTMIDERDWAPALAALGAPLETVAADAAALRRLGEKAGADLLLLVRVSAGERALVSVEVRSLRSGAVIGEVRELWPAAASTAPIAAVSPKPTPVPAVSAGPEEAAAVVSPAAPAPPAPSEGEYVVRDLPGAARALAVGDILGEGRADILVSDGHGLSLRRWEAAEVAWRWDERPRRGRRILSLDAADLDGDGRAEVLVTTIAAGRVVTELRSWRDGGLAVLARAEGLYLRAAPRAGGSPLLLGQRAGIDEVLAGRVEEYRWREGKVGRVEGTALPPGTGIFGLALAPPSSGAAYYSLKSSGYLYALGPGGEPLWRSARTYGGYPPPMEAADFGGPGGFGGGDDQAFAEAARAFQGRLLVEETARGVRLLVPRNGGDSPVVLTRLRSLGKGRLVALAGPATSLEEAGGSREFDGFVSDLARADVDGDGSPEVLFAVSRMAGPLLGERGKLVLWRPEGPPDAKK